MVEFSSEEPSEMTYEEQRLFIKASQRIDPNFHAQRQISRYFTDCTEVTEPDWDDIEEVRQHLVSLDPEYEEAMNDLRTSYDTAVREVARFMLAELSVAEAHDRADHRVFSMLIAKARIARIDGLTVDDIQRDI